MRSADRIGAAGSARWLLAVAGLMIAAGGVLLGLQVDGNGALAGTGYGSLAIGALVALVATLLQLGAAGRLPRDATAAASSVSAFLGLAFVVSGVLAPGGPWMFFEVFVLLWMLARRSPRAQAGGPEVAGGSLLLLGLMLLFRLWITWQGSRHQWQVASIDIPVISWIPFHWIDPIRSVSLGSFTPVELGFPPAGLDAARSSIVWAVGFSLCAVGLWLRGRAAREHESDRVHALIQTLPPPVAQLVERLLPEEEWEALGLHGLSERVLAKRIEGLVTERIRGYQQVQSALETGPLAGLSLRGGFAGDISQALSSLTPGDSGRPGSK